LFDNKKQPVEGGLLLSAGCFLFAFEVIPQHKVYELRERSIIFFGNGFDLSDYIFIKGDAYLAL